MAFDPQAATAAYIDSIGAEALAKAAAYTTGSHWLLLWNLLVSALAAWLIVRSGILGRISAKFDARRVNLKAFVIAAAYFIVANLISLPWTLYQEWWRELGYGRTSQPIGDFLGQSALSVAIFSVFIRVFFGGV